LKAISPLIASVLLIAFTVAVAGIVSGWLQGFTRSTTSTVTSQSNTELVCSYAGISLSTVKYSTTDYTLSGNVENTGQVGIGVITLQIFFANGSSPNNLPLCSSGTVFSCTTGNLSLIPREMTSFNVSSGSNSFANINKVRVFSNCSSVYDSVTNSQITT
jgi:flagellin-like protein